MLLANTTTIFDQYFMLVEKGSTSNKNYNKTIENLCLRVYNKKKLARCNTKYSDRRESGESERSAERIMLEFYIN